MSYKSRAELFEYINLFSEASRRDFIESVHQQVIPVEAGASTIALQEANDTLAAGPGGIILMLAGAHTANASLVIDSGVYLIGQGSAATSIELVDGSDVDVIQTRDFETLTGSNKWFVDTEGVPHGFGFVGFRIDGNKANQTAGAGIKIYGKRYYVRDLIINDAKEQGFYSECAIKGGQLNYRDMPESIIDSIWVKECGSHGIEYRGPHDGTLRFAAAVSCKGTGTQRGIYCRTDGSTYNGALDIGYIHSYDNDIGFENDAKIKGWGIIQVESNEEQGAIIGASENLIGGIYSFNNGETTATAPSVQLDCSESQINAMNVRTTAANAVGVKGGAGTKITIPAMYVDCDEAAGTTAIEWGTSQSQFNATVEGAAVGLDLDRTGGTRECIINLVANEIATDVVIASVAGAKRNTINVVGESTGSPDLVDAGVVIDDTNEINASYLIGASQVQSRSRVVVGSIDMTLTTEQSFPVNHNCYKTPAVEDILTGALRSNATGWALDYIKFDAPTSTQVTFKVKLGTAAASGTGSFAALFDVS